MKKISIFWQYFLLILFILIVCLVTLLLFMEKVSVSGQVDYPDSVNQEMVENELKNSSPDANEIIEIKEIDSLDSMNKKESKFELRSDGSRIVPPVLVKKVYPEYPKEAQKEGLQGKVIFEAEIDANGRIKATKLLKSCHPILVSATRRAIQEWIYRPMRCNDQPCVCFATITCVFRLTKIRKKIPVLVWSGII